MSSTGGILQHGDVAVVLARHTWVCTQTLDAELGESETLNLWDIDGGIEVEQVGWRAVSLVAHEDTMAMRPVHPLLGEVLQEEVAERLAVVGQDSVSGLAVGGLAVSGFPADRVLLAQQFGQVLAQVVAATLLKFVEECWRPVGTIDLVAVVEERMRPADARFGKGFVETFQVVAHGIAVEVVDDKPLATRGCALHLLLSATYLNAVDGFPVYLLLMKHRLTRRLVQRHQRTTKGPSRATVHIHLDALGFGNVLHVLQGLHPLGRQKLQLIAFVAFDTIQRRDFYCSDARLGIFRQVPL